MSMKAVLARYHAAVGSVTPASVEDWKIDELGMSGALHVIAAGGNYRQIETLGPFHYERGRFEGQAWRQNANGLTLLLAADRGREPIGVESVRFAADAPGLRMLGETDTSYVAQIDSVGGPTEWLFFGKASGLLERLETREGERRFVLTLEDYRVTGSERRPWHMHASDGRPENDIDWRLLRLRAPALVRQDDLDVPPNARPLVEFPAGTSRVSLPAQFVDGYVVVSASVNGLDLNFLLDSGCSDISLDSAVTERLRLPGYGHSSQSAAGPFVQTQTIVPELQLGALRLHSVTASSLPLAFETSTKTHVDGLLGFDFFANAVVHVDYEAGRVEAIDRDEFDPKQIPGAIALPVTLDEGVPLVGVRVGSTASGRFIIDSGATDVCSSPALRSDTPMTSRIVAKGAPSTRALRLFSGKASEASCAWSRPNCGASFSRARVSPASSAFEPTAKPNSTVTATTASSASRFSSTTTSTTTTPIRA